MDDILYDGDGGRPRVKKPSKQKKSKYRQDQSVYWLVSGGTQREGPYVIESVISQKKYTLCTSDGTSVNNGDEVEDKDLQSADGSS
ncbi:hypothetical protein F4818DRAFT_412367 [Hypoxylon cercidicola]|nr:hypothetical protein F4818DRAFT_412367 [Hypoxylon cercidicola]